MKTDSKTQIIIIGGGIAGLSLACLMANRGIYSVIVDKMPAIPYKEAEHGGRTAALMHEGVALLREIGIWDNLRPSISPLETMRIIDDGNPNIENIDVQFQATEAGHDEFGFNIPNNLLRERLYQHAETSDFISLQVPQSLESINHEKNHVVVTLDNGHQISGNLVIGADGKFSKTRALFSIKHKEIEYNQSAITCLIKHTKDHQNISTEHHRSGGPFTLVPMPSKNGDFFSSIVWVEKTEDANKFKALSKDELAKAIEERCHEVAGKIELVSTPETWPLKAVLSDKITGQRMALIAEAAHAMSPIGAQGLNLSMRDVGALSDIIYDALKRGEDIGTPLVLDRYASARRLDIDSRFYGVDQYNKIVSNNVELLRGIRRTGLKTLNTIPALKKIAMTVGLRSTQNN